jgi:quinol monooxygenase YgiN
MIVVYVAVKTKENVTREFERIMDEIQGDVRRMTGCMKNEWFRDAKAERRYVMYGEFDTHENFDAYLNSPIVKRIGAEIMPLLESPPEFKHYEATAFDGN